MKGKVFRPRLTYRELQLLGSMVDERYRALRRSVREERKKIKAGWSDDWFYPFAEKVRDLEDLGRLLRKLNRLLIGKYTINVPKLKVSRIHQDILRIIIKAEYTINVPKRRITYLEKKFLALRQKMNETAKKFAILGINPLVWFIHFGDKRPNKEAKCEDCKLFKGCKRGRRFPLECMRQTSTAFLLKYADKDFFEILVK